MALYLGNTLVTPSFGHNPLWWSNAGECPEFLYATNYFVYMKDMTDHDSISPSTTEKSLSHPAGMFTFTSDSGTVTNSTAGNNIIYDRYGYNYHNGERFDFEKYSYVVVTDCFSVDTYTGDESQMTTIHTLRNSYTSIAYFGLSFKTLTNGTILYYGDEGYTAYISLNVLTRYYNLYRNASKNIMSYAGTYGGVYGIVYSPALSSTASLTPDYLNFYTPYYRYRVNATVHAAASFNSLNHNTTYIKLRLKLYRIIAPNGLGRDLFARLGYMLANAAFPTDIL